MKKIYFLLLILFIFSTSFNMSCNEKQNKSENANRQTNNDSISKDINTNVENIYTLPDSIEFSFVVYDKYMIISPFVDISYFGKNYELFDKDYEFSFVCDVDINNLPVEYKNFIGKEFSFIDADENTKKFKIKDLKIIMRETPHFGTVQNANDSENKAQTLFEHFVQTAAIYLVGEIEATEKDNLVFARSSNLKPYEKIQKHEDYQIPDNYNTIIAENLELKEGEFEFSDIFVSKKETYFLVTYTKTSEMCGEEYDYTSSVIIKIDKKNNFEIVYDADADELEFIMDINTDGIPEFMFLNKFEDSEYIIDISNKIKEEFLKFENPYLDCPC